LIIIKGDPGTVSHGTLRSEDLILAFSQELEQLLSANKPYMSKEEYVNRLTLIKEVEDLIEDDSEDKWETVEADDLTLELMDSLNEFAPDGYYFGVIDGDGSDFGFWKSEEVVDFG